jgi:hypothetical protein
VSELHVLQDAFFANHHHNESMIAFAELAAPRDSAPDLNTLHISSFLHASLFRRYKELAFGRVGYLLSLYLVWKASLSAMTRGATNSRG